LLRALGGYCFLPLPENLKNQIEELNQRDANSHVNCNFQSAARRLSLSQQIRNVVGGLA
jgi:hypothetical protein